MDNYKDRSPGLHMWTLPLLTPTTYSLVHHQNFRKEKEKKENITSTLFPAAHFNNCNSGYSPHPISCPTSTRKTNSCQALHQISTPSSRWSFAASGSMRLDNCSPSNPVAWLAVGGAAQRLLPSLQFQQALLCSAHLRQVPC